MAGTPKTDWSHPPEKHPVGHYFTWGVDSAPQNRILAGLDTNELHQLMPHLQHTSWHNGETLREAGAPLDCCYFPESGMVCALAVMEDGPTVALAAVGREGFLGVSAFLGSDSALLRAVGLIAGEALELNRQDLGHIFPVSPQFAASLRRYSAHHLEQGARLGACHALHSVQQRVAVWLLLARDHSDSDSLPLTHQALSELLGCRRSSITDALLLLENARIIHAGRGHITISDRARLIEQTCECYRLLRDCATLR